MTREEIARQLASELTSESDVGSDSDESDCVQVLATGDDPLPDVLPESDSDADELPPPPAPDSGALQQAQTVSQRKLAEANLQPVQQPSATFQRRRVDHRAGTGQPSKRLGQHLNREVWTEKPRSPPDSKLKWTHSVFSSLLK